MNELITETKNRAGSVIKAASSSGRFSLTKLPLLADSFGGGIQRRLLFWGLGLFGTALLVMVGAGYLYMASQIRHDAAALQSELAVVTAEQIRTFVRRKIERFSDNADALSLYPLGSKEQQLLLGLLVKNDNSFTHASIINSDGMEVVKVSDRRVYFPSDLIDQSRSPKFINALKGEDFISPVYTSIRAQPYVTLAIPLWGAAQSVAGVVSAEADLSFLWEAIGKIQFGTAGYAYLVDEHGNLIAHKDATLVLKRMNLREVDGVKKFLRNPTRSDPSPAHEGSISQRGNAEAFSASLPRSGSVRRSRYHRLGQPKNYKTNTRTTAARGNDWSRQSRTQSRYQKRRRNRRVSC
jgi:hypothetical protein